MAPETIAIHYPFYPSSKEDDKEYVTFYLDKVGGGPVKRIVLLEAVFDIDDDGNPVVNPNYIELNSWSRNDLVFPILYKKSEIYPENKYINYIFKVFYSKYSYQHSVSFVSRPYFKAIQSDSSECLPVPVYIVSNRNVAMNCVIIPDFEMVCKQDINANECEKLQIKFYDHVCSIIHNSIQKESLLRKFRNLLNFYVNPVPSDYRIYTKPRNSKNISFAQSKMILHSVSDRDRTTGPIGNKYSTSEYYSFGTFLHELSHGLFLLMDEYKGGDHEQFPFPFANNWFNKTDATLAAQFYKLPVYSVKKIEDNVWKLCNDNCIMNNSGIFIYKYGYACKRVVIATLANKKRIKFDLTDLVNFEDEIIKRINKLDNKSKFDINYGSHIGFMVKINNRTNEIQVYDFEKRNGALPYNSYFNNSEYFKGIAYTYTSGIKVSYFLPIYFQSTIYNSDNFFCFELLMPYTRNIIEIDLNINKQLTFLFDKKLLEDGIKSLF